MNEVNFKDMFSSIEKNAESRTAVNEGDYLVDGLLYCGKCNTPKQCRVMLFGEERTPYCICKCRKEELEAEEERQRQQELQLKIMKLRNMGFPESEMQGWTFAKDDRTNEKITKIAMNYVENFAEMKKRGKGLLFYGSVGTGKTFTAACISNALIDRGIPCLMTNFSRLVNTISGMYDGKQQYIDGLNRFHLMVIDDLAAERDTEFMNEIVFNIIDSRYRAGLPTIVTTNLSSNELNNPTDVKRQRTYSRLLEMCIPIAVEGKDRRKQKLRDDYNELNELLGL
ncbi:ATP-binding protein [Solibacillus silvestris]